MNVCYEVTRDFLRALKSASRRSIASMLCTQ